MPSPLLDTLQFDVSLIRQPNADGIVKFALHAGGYLNPTKVDESQDPVSQPRTIVSHPQNGTAIPKEVIADLPRELATIYPELAKMPFERTRMCWYLFSKVKKAFIHLKFYRYSDTADAYWLIDSHPKHPKLLFATGGSGHAYKVRFSPRLLLNTQRLTMS